MNAKCEVMNMFPRLAPTTIPTVSLTIAAVLCAIPSGAFAAAAASGGKSAVINIGDQRQVFIDGRFLAESRNVELTVHRPRKTGEKTLVADRPWEGKYVDTYSCVMQVGNLYHLWYPADAGLCYARSKDGIHWEKPSLGLAEFQGSRDNNIVVGLGAGGIDKCGSEGMVFYDPTAPEDQRFRYATRISDELKDTVVFSSPDGIHWRLTHQKVLTFTHPTGRQHLDSQNVIFWDDRINKYVAYMRFNQHKPGYRGRSVARAESDRLGGFTEVQEAPIVLEPDSLDASMGGHPCMDYYTSGAIKYPWAQDAYYMFPQTYFHYVPKQLAEFPDQTPVNAGPLHTQFAASRDGISWHRFDRRPFVSLGMKGDFDSKNARVFWGLVLSVDGREMYNYYVGSDHLHGWGRDEKNNRLFTEAGLQPALDTSIISRLVSRRDGFISVRAAYSGGEFTTPPLVFSGGKLALNIDTSATGIAQVGILDEAGLPIDGFSADQCDRIHTCNETDRVVSWRRQGDVSKLAGRSVRLRFVMRDCDLYAFQFGK